MIIRGFVFVFQFQYGTIESFDLNDQVFSFFISIPVWYDWEFGQSMLASVIPRFQFQYGTIESLLFSKCEHISKDISIPVWYDWEGVYRSNPRIDLLFQFQYGTIERVLIYCYFTVVLHFNSSMVRLRVWFCTRISRLPKTISIPVWYDWEPIQYRQ